MSDFTLASQRKSLALPPTDEEQAAWDALSRDEQVRKLREHFASEAANAVSYRTKEEVLASARGRLQKKV